MSWWNEIEKFASGVVNGIKRAFSVVRLLVKPSVCDAVLLHGHDEVLMCLPYLSLENVLASGAPVDAVSEWGRTALEMAIMDNKLDLVPVLVSAGADVDRRGRNDRTPLQGALLEFDVAAVRALTSVGANVNGVSGEDDSKSPGFHMPKDPLGFALFHTPEDLSKTWRQREMVEILLEKGAKPRDEHVIFAVNSENFQVLPALAKAGCRASPDVVFTAIVAGNDAMIRAVLDMAGDIRAPVGNFGNTLAHVAAGTEKGTFLPELAKLGVDVNKGDNNGCTPLHVAILHQDVFAAQTLLALGADVNAALPLNEGWEGETPLHLALDTGNVEMAALLLAAGADRTRASKSGVTPAMMADLDAMFPPDMVASVKMAMGQPPEKSPAPSPAPRMG